MAGPAVRVRRLRDALLEPMVGVGLVVEGRDLAVAARTVEGDGLAQGAVRLESDDSGTPVPRQLLELPQDPTTEPEAASLRLHPHPLQLGRGTVVELEGAAADRPRIDAGDEQRTRRRRQLVGVGGDAERGIEAGL